MNTQPPLPSATFVWGNVPNMTACAPATISWTYTGPPQELRLTAHPSRNLSFAVDATLQNYTVPLVYLAPGEYTMTVSGAQDIDIPKKQPPFFVVGSDTSCLATHAPVSPRDTTSSTTSTNSSKTAAMFGGIAVGVGGFVALVTAGFYFRWRTVWKRLRREHKANADLPGYNGPWDASSHETSMTGSVSEQHLIPPQPRGTSEMRMNSSNTSSGVLPRLEPNRRPPSTVLGLSESTTSTPEQHVPRPLPRLEPNRRKPSIANMMDEPAPPKDSTTLIARPESPTPPVSAPTAPEVDLEAEFKLIATPRSIPIPAPILLGMPKPPRRNTRLSAASAYTTASTALSDMSLLKPGVRTTAQVDLQRALALAKLGAVTDSPYTIPPAPPLPSIPLSTDTPPPRIPSPSAASTMFTVRSPSPTNTITPLASSHVRSPISPISPAFRVPTSPRIQVLQRQASQSQSQYHSSSLSRSGSTRSTRTNRSARKPVPPLDPSDAATTVSGTLASSDADLWSTRRSSYADSTQTWNGRGSPVPSSSTSQMYRIRDSAWSEWTWTRPMEDWEKEQLRVIANVNMTEGNGVPGGGIASGSRSVGEGILGNPLGRAGSKKGVSNLRHQSFGEMKVMRSIIPDVPPASGRDYPQERGGIIQE